MVFRLAIARTYAASVNYIREVPYAEIMTDLRRNESLPASVLWDMQNEKLLRLLWHMNRYNPWYVSLVTASGMTLDRIRGLEDLHLLPVLTKEQLRDAYPAAQSQSHNGRLFSGATSGSTGISFNFQYDSSHLGWSEACKWRGRQWWGGDIGDPSVTLWGQPLVLTKPREWLFRAKGALRNTVLVNTFGEMSPQFAKAIGAVIPRKKPTYLYGYGSSFAHVAQHLAAQDFNVGEKHRPEFIHYTADHMSSQEKSLVARVFNCPVVSDYGASEAPGIAMECDKRNMHVSVDNYLVETLDSAGVGVDNGTAGEIVVTALHNFAMPFIRYRLGDLGALNAATCQCGRTLPLMELKAGKAVDLITTSSVSDLSAHILDYINLSIMHSGIRGIRQFYLEQTGLDEFILYLVMGPEQRIEAERRFVEALYERLGSQIDVSVFHVDQVPVQQTGKRRYFKRRFENSSEVEAAS